MHVLPAWFMHKYHILFRDVMYEEDTDEQMELNVGDFQCEDIRFYIREQEKMIGANLII